MKYKWIDYKNNDSNIVDSWLDDEAIANTGCNEGFNNFYEYWLDYPGFSLGKNYWSKLIIDENGPFAVISFCLNDKNITIMEIIIDSKKRNRSMGSSLLSELVLNSQDIIKCDVESFDAVIFPKNKQSQKAFEKVGFKIDHTIKDNDAWHYKYNK